MAETSICSIDPDAGVLMYRGYDISDLATPVPPLTELDLKLIAVTPLAGMAPVLAVVVIAALLSSITLKEWGVLGLVVAAAVLVYVVNVRARETA